eukprot:gnl/MRDRNA2_/MRDRNA2_80736_c0_seq1.p1 gnl/MRDRNA2_/MRDRNA2_80736_c0~~gnl/MRDRNA2_/MRDRNA2_80736_c0_seq1.p1  ORF type:complete len:1340 (+),score=312.53 gnl/MRDRNA2_/MRDRNA2_80736_c0_seq1:237-4022(+)
MGPRSEFGSGSKYETIDISQCNKRLHKWNKIDSFQTPHGHCTDIEDAPAFRGGCHFNLRSFERVQKDLMSNISKELKTQELVLRREITRATNQMKDEFQKSIQALVSQKNNLQAAEDVAKKMKSDMSLEIESLRRTSLVSQKEDVLSPILHAIEGINKNINTRQQAKVDLQPILDAISRIHVEPHVDFAPVLDAVTKLSNPSPEVTVALQTIAGEISDVMDKISKTEDSISKLEIQPHVDIDLRPVVEMISKVDVQPQVDLQPVLKAVETLPSIFQKDMQSMIDVVASIDVKPQVDLKEVVDAIQHIEVQPQVDVNLKPFMEAVAEVGMHHQGDLQAVLNTISRLDAGIQDEMRVVQGKLAEVSQRHIDLQPVLDAIAHVDVKHHVQEILDIVAKIHAKPEKHVDLQPVLKAVAKINVRPEVNLDEILEAITRIDVKPQVDLQPAVDKLLDAIAQIDVKPEVNVDLKPATDELASYISIMGNCLDSSFSEVKKAVSKLNTDHVTDTLLKAIAEIDVQPVVDLQKVLDAVSHTESGLDGKVHSVQMALTRKFSQLETLLEKLSQPQEAIDLRPLSDSIAEIDRKHSEKLYPQPDLPDLDLGPVLHAIKSMDLRPQVDLQSVLDAIARINLAHVVDAITEVDKKVLAAFENIDVKLAEVMKPSEVDLQPTLDCIKAETLDCIKAEADRVVSNSKEAHKTGLDVTLQVLDAVKGLDAKEMIDLSPVLEAVRAIDVKPQIDFKPNLILDALAAHTSKLASDIEGVIESECSKHQSEARDAARRTNNNLQQVLDAVVSIRKDVDLMKPTDLGMVLEAIEKIKVPTATDLQALLPEVHNREEHEMNLQPVLDAIGQIVVDPVVQVTSTGNDAELQRVLEAVADIKSLVQALPANLKPEPSKESKESKVDLGSLTKKIDGLSAGLMNSKVDLQPVLGAIAKIDVKSHTQECSCVVLDAVNALRKEMGKANVDLDPVNQQLQRLHSEVHSAIKEIDINPQVDVGAILEAIGGIDVKVQVQEVMHEQLQLVLDAVARIDVNPVVDSQGILDAIKQIHVEPQVDLRLVLNAVKGAPGTGGSGSSGAPRIMRSPVRIGGGYYRVKDGEGQEHDPSMHDVQQNMARHPHSPGRKLQTFTNGAPASMVGSDRYLMGCYLKHVDVLPKGCSSISGTQDSDIQLVNQFRMLKSGADRNQELSDMSPRSPWNGNQERHRDLDASAYSPGVKMGRAAEVSVGSQIDPHASKRRDHYNKNNRLDVEEHDVVQKLLAKTG